MAATSAPQRRPRSKPPAGGDRAPSLQRSLLLGMLLLVLTPAVASSWWMSRLARQTLVRRHAEHAATVAQTLAGALPEEVTVDSVRPMAALRTLEQDPNVAFVAVFDTAGREVARLTSNHEAHAAYDLWAARVGPAARQRTSEPIRLTDAGEVIAWQSRAWRAAAAAETDQTPSGPRLEPAGTVVVGLQDRGLAAAVGALQAAQFTTAGLVCLLSVPLIAWFARRWTRPLRAMVAVVRGLAHGQMPRDVIIGRHREIADLLASFNQLARDLYATQLRLQRANATLAQRIDQRTHERDHARAELETEIRQRHEFLETLRDELGDRLGHIDAMATTLLLKYRDRLDGDLEQQLRRIDTHVQQQSQRVGELLALVSLRTTPGRRACVDLNDLLADLALRFEPALKDAGIKLHLPADPAALPTVSADHERLGRVFATLIENAIVHMGDAATRQINIAFAGDPEGAELCFTVSDTGAGIEPQHRARLFDPFAGSRGGRGVGAPEFAAAGSGLKLAAAKAIVESYGGRIWVESSPGRGSVFHFTLAGEKVGSAGLADDFADEKAA